MNKNSDSKYEKGILDGTEDILTEKNLSCICSWADSAIVLIIRYSGKNVQIPVKRRSRSGRTARPFRF